MDRCASERDRNGWDDRSEGMGGRDAHRALSSTSGREGVNMATMASVQKPIQPTDAGPVIYRLTGFQFMEMLRARIFPKGSQVQLIRGILATERVNRATTWYD